MAIIGSADVAFRARTEKFNQNVNRARKGLKRFGGEVDKTRRFMVGLSRVLLAGVVVQGFNRLRKSMDDLGKTSQKLGIAVEELQSLRHAAQLTGVEARTLDMGLQRMVRRISEAAQGAGEAKDAIRELGLEAGQLSKLTPERQFQVIADAMQNVELQSDKVRLAMRLFDSEGVALVNTLDLTGEGLRDINTQLARQGALMSGDAISRIEDMNDRWLDTEAVFKALGAEILNTFGPALEWVAKSLTTILRASRAGAGLLRDIFIRPGVPHTTPLDLKGALQRAGQTFGAGIPVVPGMGKPKLGGHGPTPSGYVPVPFRRSTPTPSTTMTGIGSLDLFSDRLDRMEESFQKAIELSNRLESSGQQMGFTFARAFEEMILGASDFASVIQSLAQDIARIALQTAVTQPLGGAIGGAFGDFMKLLSGAGSTSGVMEPIKAVSGNVVTIDELFVPGVG